MNDQPRPMRRDRINRKAKAIAADVRTADFPQAVSIIAGLLARAERDKFRVRQLADELSRLLPSEKTEDQGLLGTAVPGGESRPPSTPSV